MSGHSRHRQRDPTTRHRRQRQGEKQAQDVLAAAGTYLLWVCDLSGLLSLTSSQPVYSGHMRNTGTQNGIGLWCPFFRMPGKPLFVPGPGLTGVNGMFSSASAYLLPSTVLAVPPPHDTTHIHQLHHVPTCTVQWEHKTAALTKSGLSALRGLALTFVDTFRNPTEYIVQQPS